MGERKKGRKAGVGEDIEEKNEELGEQFLKLAYDLKKCRGGSE